ncbi:hypothetical protein OH77DRAFT_136667 [Trametes cingulata]|nr:hypothetical protein OH77DRAFT_136667 [Trametes cingulata]
MAHPHIAHSYSPRRSARSACSSSPSSSGASALSTPGVLRGVWTKSSRGPSSPPPLRAAQGRLPRSSRKTLRAPLPARRPHPAGWSLSAGRRSWGAARPAPSCRVRTWQGMRPSRRPRPTLPPRRGRPSRRTTGRARACKLWARRSRRAFPPRESTPTGTVLSSSRWRRTRTCRCLRRTDFWTCTERVCGMPDRAYTRESLHGGFVRGREPLLFRTSTLRGQRGFRHKHSF